MSQYPMSQKVVKIAVKVGLFVTAQNKKNW